LLLSAASASCQVAVVGFVPTYFVYLVVRSSKRIVTVWPASFPIDFRTSALIGSMCLPLPIAMNELRNGYPSIVPRIFTRPLVPKNLTESGQIT